MSGFSCVCSVSAAAVLTAPVCSCLRAVRLCAQVAAVAAHRAIHRWCCLNSCGGHVPSNLSTAAAARALCVGFWWVSAAALCARLVVQVYCDSVLGTRKYLVACDVCLHTVCRGGAALRHCRQTLRCKRHLRNHSRMLKRLSQLNLYCVM
jgi:hypothetical protein